MDVHVERAPIVGRIRDSGRDRRDERTMSAVGRIAAALAGGLILTSCAARSCPANHGSRVDPETGGLYTSTADSGPQVFADACYDPKAPRIALHGVDWGGTCSRDGDCGECEYACQRVSRGMSCQMMGRSGMDQKLRHALCGCLDRQCTWFEQR